MPSAPAIRAAAVALNTRGDAIVAWTQHRAHRRGNDVRARMRHANGTLTKVRIAGPTAPVQTIALTLTGGRHGVVSWFSQPVSEGSVGGSLAVSRVDMSSGGALGKRRLLDTGTPWGHGEADAVDGAPARDPRRRPSRGRASQVATTWCAPSGTTARWARSRPSRRGGPVEQLGHPAPPGVRVTHLIGWEPRGQIAGSTACAGPRERPAFPAHPAAER